MNEQLINKWNLENTSISAIARDPGYTYCKESKKRRVYRSPGRQVVCIFGSYQYGIWLLLVLIIKKIKL